MATKRKTKSPKSGNEPKKRRESAQSTRTTRAAAKAELEPQADPTSDSEAELGQHVENSANRASNNETAEASATQAAPQVEQHVLEDNRTSATETAEASAIQATSHIEQLRSQVADYERQVKAAYSTSRLARPKIDWQGHLAGWAAQSAAIANSINPDLSVVNFPTVLDTELASWRAFMDMGGDITLLEHMDFMLSVLWWHQSSQRGLDGTVPFRIKFFPAQLAGLSEKKAGLLLHWLELQKNRTAWLAKKKNYGLWESQEWYVAAFGERVP